MNLLPNMLNRLSWLGTALSGVRSRGLVARSGGLAVLTLVLLVSPFFLSHAHAQAIEAATLLAPWPPPGWPEGAKGEVRIVTGNDPSSLVTVLSFPVEDDGSVTYNLPERLPDNLPEAVFTALKPADFVSCAEVAPVVSPAGVEVASLTFVIYGDGDLWGTLDMSEELQTGLVTGESREVVGVYYASQPVTVTGSGTCANGIALRYDIALGSGPRLLLGSGNLGTASFVFTFETTDRFELSQRPVMFGSE